MNIIFLGAPGAGKGTQAEKVAEKFGIPTVSTGNIIREALRSGSPMGRKAKAYTEAGQLVPDEVVIGIIRDRLTRDDCQRGFILDGFPRTIPQAQALDEMEVRIDRVIDIEVPDERIVARMSGRRVCPQCGASFHIEYKQPASEGLCDLCGAALVIRKDDAPETVLARLAVYHTETEPLKDYYAKKGILRIVEGQEEVADTTALTLKAVEA